MHEGQRSTACGMYLDIVRRRWVLSSGHNFTSGRDDCGFLGNFGAGVVAVVTGAHPKLCRRQGAKQSMRGCDWPKLPIVFAMARSPSAGPLTLLSPSPTLSRTVASATRASPASYATRRQLI